MPDTRYSYNVDLDNPTTSHGLAILLVAPGSTVLDIGAADGSVARPLAARGCRVWAIEVDADAAAKARSACERVIVGNVEDLDLETVLEGRRFDVILLLDVLEHLREPLVTLERARELLAPGGRIIASIPNVTHGAVRVSMMSGAFTYTETGLLDKTHLRFFDRRSAEALFGDAKLRIVERLRVTRGLTETEIPVDPSAVPPQILQMLETDPEATTYQFVLAGVASESAHVSDGISLAEQLQRRTEELQAEYRRLEGYAQSLDQRNRDQAETVSRLTADTATLEEELHRIRTELQSEIVARKREATQGQIELRHVHADLAVKEAFIAELRQAADAARLEKEASVAALAASREQSKAALEEELQRVRTELHSELAVRMRELGQGHMELRHLQADLLVKEAFIVELREEAERARARYEQLRIFASSAGFQIVTRITTWLSRYPRMFGTLQRLARRIAGRRTLDS